VRVRVIACIGVLAMIGVLIINIIVYRGLHMPMVVDVQVWRLFCEF